MGLIKNRWATDKLDALLYANYQGNWDDRLFRQHIELHASADDIVLDLGAGAGIVESMNVRGKFKKVCGVDPDPRVVDNPYLDDGRVGVGESIPWEDESFDVVFADNVLEHLDDPTTVFREVARVLKPGGRFLAKTPNYHHYVARIASVTPTAVHKRVAAMRGRAFEDTFPTRYKANTRKDIAHHGQAAGLELRSVELIEGRPEYLRPWWPAYLAGAAYERAVNASRRLSRFRVVLIATLDKPGRG